MKNTEIGGEPSTTPSRRRARRVEGPGREETFPWDEPRQKVFKATEDFSCQTKAYYILAGRDSMQRNFFFAR